MKAIYFSPTFSTKKIVEKLASSLDQNFESIDITMDIENKITIDKNEIVIVGIPVYSGRVPLVACNILEKISSNKAKVISIAVYGNRHYDNALIELNQLLDNQGFNIIASAAFIAEHSFSNEIATNRPDSDDFKKIQEFASLIKEKLYNNNFPKITVPGTLPLADRKVVLLKAKANENCTQCGLCAPSCPTQAIDYNNARITNNDLCFCCLRCIKICPENARDISLTKEKKHELIKGLKARCKEYKEAEFFI